MFVTAWVMLFDLTGTNAIADARERNILIWFNKNDVSVNGRKFFPNTPLWQTCTRGLLMKFFVHPISGPFVIDNCYANYKAELAWIGDVPFITPFCLTNPAALYAEKRNFSNPIQISISCPLSQLFYGRGEICWASESCGILATQSTYQCGSTNYIVFDASDLIIFGKLLPKNECFKIVCAHMLYFDFCAIPITPRHLFGVTVNFKAAAVWRGSDKAFKLIPRPVPSKHSSNIHLHNTHKSNTENFENSINNNNAVSPKSFELEPNISTLSLKDSSMSPIHNFIEFSGFLDFYDNKILIFGKPAKKSFCILNNFYINKKPCRSKEEISEFFQSSKKYSYLINSMSYENKERVLHNYTVNLTSITAWVGAEPEINKHKYNNLSMTNDNEGLEYQNFPKSAIDKHNNTSVSDHNGKYNNSESKISNSNIDIVSKYIKKEVNASSDSSSKKNKGESLVKKKINSTGTLNSNIDIVKQKINEPTKKELNILSDYSYNKNKEESIIKRKKSTDCKKNIQTPSTQNSRSSVCQLEEIKIEPEEGMVSGYLLTADLNEALMTSFHTTNLIVFGRKKFYINGKKVGNKKCFENFVTENDAVIKAWIVPLEMPRVVLNCIALSRALCAWIGKEPDELKSFKELYYNVKFKNKSSHVIKGKKDFKLNGYHYFVGHTKKLNASEGIILAKRNKQEYHISFTIDAVYKYGVKVADDATLQSITLFLDSSPWSVLAKYKKTKVDDILCEFEAVAIWHFRNQTQLVDEFSQKLPIWSRISATGFCECYEKLTTESSVNYKGLPVKAKYFTTGKDYVVYEISNDLLGIGYARCSVQNLWIDGCCCAFSSCDKQRAAHLLIADEIDPVLINNTNVIFHASCGWIGKKPECILEQSEDSTPELSCHKQKAVPTSFKNIPLKANQNIQNEPIKNKVCDNISEANTKPIFRGKLHQIHSNTGCLKNNNGEIVYFQSSDVYLYGASLKDVELWNVLIQDQEVDFCHKDGFPNIADVVWIGQRFFSNINDAISNIEKWCNKNMVVDTAREILISQLVCE